MIQFATSYAQPVRFSPLPFEAFVYVAESYSGGLFFEQRYLDHSRAVLEVVSTAIPPDKRGLLRLLANDAHLKAAAFMELTLTDTDTATLAGAGERITLPVPDAIDTAPSFTTTYSDAVAFSGMPYEVSILVDESMAGRQMYFERRYLDANGTELEIRSTTIPETALGKRVRLKLDTNPLECAARVELAIVDTYNGYTGNCEGLPPVDSKIFDFTFDFTFE